MYTPPWSFPHNYLPRPEGKPNAGGPGRQPQRGNDPGSISVAGDQKREGNHHRVAAMHVQWPWPQSMVPRTSKTARISGTGGEPRPMPPVLLFLLLTPSDPP